MFKKKGVFTHTLDSSISSVVKKNGNEDTERGEIRGNAYANENLGIILSLVLVLSICRKAKRKIRILESYPYCGW